MLKARQNVMLRYLKKKQVGQEGVQIQFQNQRNFNLKFQTLIIGSICTEDIPGTELFDTGDNQRENNASNSATHVISTNVCNATTVILELPSIVNTKHPFA